MERIAKPSQNLTHKIQEIHNESDKDIHNDGH